MFKCGWHTFSIHSDHYFQKRSDPHCDPSQRQVSWHDYSDVTALTSRQADLYDTGLGWGPENDKDVRAICIEHCPTNPNDVV